jgi:hypothetical protein
MRVITCLCLILILTACVAPVQDPNEQRAVTEIPKPIVQPTATPTSVSSALEPSSSASPTATTPSSPVPLTKASIATCPVTLPNGSTPPGERYPSPNHHGNGALWATLGMKGKVLIGSADVEKDGSLGAKFGWYRGVHGQLTIEGRRLDALARSVRAWIPDGYGDIGFQSTAIYFSTEGCWEVTGKVGDASLTFVTLVVKSPFGLSGPTWLPSGLMIKDYDINALPKSLRYIFSTPTGGEVSIEKTKGLPAKPASYPTAAQTQVAVRGQPAQCVQGTWDAQRQWRNEADAGSLEWTAGDFSYRISHAGLGLHCGDLLRMAESLS